MTAHIVLHTQTVYTVTDNDTGEVLLTTTDHAEALTLIGNLAMAAGRAAAAEEA